MRSGQFPFTGIAVLGEGAQSCHIHLKTQGRTVAADARLWHENATRV